MNGGALSWSEGIAFGAVRGHRGHLYIEWEVTLVDGVPSSLRPATAILGRLKGLGGRVRCVLGRFDECLAWAAAIVRQLAVNGISGIGSCRAPEEGTASLGAPSSLVTIPDTP